MRHEDLEPADDLGERDGAIGFPLLHYLDIVDVDDEVVIFALVVDLDLGSVAAGHVEGGEAAMDSFSWMCIKGTRAGCSRVSRKYRLSGCFSGDGAVDVDASG